MEASARQARRNRRNTCPQSPERVHPAIPVQSSRSSPFRTASGAESRRLKFAYAPERHWRNSQRRRWQARPFGRLRPRSSRVAYGTAGPLSLRQNVQFSGLGLEHLILIGAPVPTDKTLIHQGALEQAIGLEPLPDTGSRLAVI